MVKKLPPRVKIRAERKNKIFFQKNGGAARD